MKQSPLSAEFEPAFLTHLEKCRQSTGFLSRLLAPPIDAPDLKAILESHDPSQIAQIEECLSRIVTDGVNEVRRRKPRMTEQETRRFTRKLISVSPSTCVALTAHAVGYVREEALRSIRSLSGPVAMALVIRRLNDWVPEIRQAARGILEAAITNPDGGRVKLDAMVLACLELVLQPHRLQRAGQKELELLDRLLSVPGVREAWKEHLLTDVSNHAARTLSMGLRHGRCVDILPQLAHEPAHAGVRRIAVAALLRGHFGWKEGRDTQVRELDIEVDRDEIAAAALKDGSVEVQALALQYILETPDSSLHCEAVFRTLLKQRSVSLSSRAAFGLTRLGVDLKAELQEAVLAQTPLPLWAARLALRYGCDTDDVYQAYMRSAVRPDVSWLAILVKEGHADAITDATELALNAEDLSLANRASRALKAAGQPIAFNRLVQHAVNPDIFYKRGLNSVVAQCSAIEISRIIALLVRSGAAGDLNELWRLAFRKRMRGAFSPRPEDLDAMEKDMLGLDKVRAKAREVLGV